jgi:hypothetical protein
MLDQKQIPVGRLKQAYGLSEREAYELLGALLPDNVFPYALWQQAYIEFWEWSVQAASFRYQVEKPSFPNTVTLPDKYFPTQLCRTPIVRFFADISRCIEIPELEKGLDYIIEATYGEEDFPYQEEKKSLFKALREEETEHRARTSGLMEISSMLAVDYFCITESFFDTIVVDKAAAVRYLNSCGYSVRQEVKGLSQAIVERVIAEASPPQSVESVPQTPLQVTEFALQPPTPVIEDNPQTSPQASESAPQPPTSPTVIVPRALWDGKRHPTIRDSMRQQEFADPVIAYVLYEWCGLKNKTKIGRLLGPDDKVDSTYRRLAGRLLAEAAALNIQPA